MILKCTCANGYQDEKYGAQMRVHNLMKTGGYACTVCGASHGGSAKAEAKVVKAGGVKAAKK